MRKNFCGLSIILIIVVCLTTFFACAAKEESTQLKELELDPKTAYEIVYDHNGYKDIYTLDGDGSITMHTSANSSESFVDIEGTLGVYLSFTNPQNGQSLNLCLIADGSTLEYESADVDEFDVTILTKEDIFSNNQLINTQTFTYEYEEPLNGDNTKLSTNLMKINFKRITRTRVYFDLVIEKKLNNVLMLSGDYEIINKNKVKIISVDSKSFPYKKYEIKNPISFNDEIRTEIQEKKGNGSVNIFLHNNNSTPIYVQLYEDGHFEFLSSRVEFSDKDTLESDYSGRVFTTEIVRYDDNDRHYFKAQLSFSSKNIKSVEFKVLEHYVENNILVQQDETGKLTAVPMKYESEIYEALIGSHAEGNKTNNNFEFSNDNKIYVCYQDEFYQFDISHLKTERYLDHTKIIVEDEFYMFTIIYKDDGSWSWYENGIRARMPAM